MRIYLSLYVLLIRNIVNIFTCMYIYIICVCVFMKERKI